MDPYKEILLSSSIEIAQIGIWRWNLITDKITLSHEAYEMLGIIPDQFDGTLEFIRNQVVHPDFRADFTSAIGHALKETTPFIREIKLQHPIRGTVWIRIHGQLYKDDINHFQEIIGTILDITTDHEKTNEIINDLNFLIALFDTSPNPIFYKDRFGIYKYCNQAFCELVNMPREKIIDHSVRDIVPSETATIYENADNALLDSRSIQMYEAQIKCFDGSTKDVLFNKALHMEGDKVLGIVGIVQDITDKKALEKKLTQFHQIKDVILDISHKILTFDSDNAFIIYTLNQLKDTFSNCQCYSILENRSGVLEAIYSDGYEQDDIDNMKIDLENSFIQIAQNGDYSKVCLIEDIKSLENNPNYYRIPRTISGATIHSLLLVPILIDNTLKWVISFDSEIPKGFLSLHIDIAEFIRVEIPLLYKILNLHQKTLFLSRYDSLTGYMTRRFFEETLTLRLATTAKGFHLVLFDLDGLKKVNDHFGHRAGDEFIIGFSNALRNEFKSQGNFARIGGDEFSAIFENMDINSLTASIEAFRTKFEASFSDHKADYTGSFSYGIATYPEDSVLKDDLLKLTDERMYLDKNKRR